MTLLDGSMPFLDAALHACGVTVLHVGNTTPAAEHLTPAQLAHIHADMTVRALRSSLWAQREALRQSLEPLASTERPEFWRAAIADTERRLAAAEVDLERSE